jgi:phosphopantothenate synthetase
VRALPRIIHHIKDIMGKEISKDFMRNEITGFDNTENLRKILNRMGNTR